MIENIESYAPLLQRVGGWLCAFARGHTHQFSLPDVVQQKLLYCLLKVCGLWKWPGGVCLFVLCQA
jgi:hypothetical protein